MDLTGHKYEVREMADGSYSVTQLPMQGGRVRRKNDYPDYVNAMLEDGTPRIVSFPYIAPTPPTFEENKAAAVEQISGYYHGRWAQLGFDHLTVNFSASVEDEWHRLMTARLGGLIYYPKRVYGSERSTYLELADGSAVDAFVMSYAGGREAILEPGRAFNQQVAAATLQAELDAIMLAFEEDKASHL